MDDAIPLPRFQEALQAHSKSLTAGTYWRYVKGLLPAFGRFIVEHPELARALADDAMQLAETRELPIVAQERG